MPIVASDLAQGFPCYFFNTSPARSIIGILRSPTL